MHPIRTAILAAVALALALAGCNNTPSGILRPNDVVLAFGDSLTYGTGANETESYPVQLQRMIGRKVVNAGVPGEVTADGRQRLPQLLDEHEPDLLILCHGGNDILRRQGREQTVANLKAMIDEARTRKIRIVLVSVPQFGLLIDSAPFYSELAETYEIPVEDDILSDILSDRDLKSDSIHPNAAGYKVMAERIADLLKENGII